MFQKQLVILFFAISYCGSIFSASLMSIDEAWKFLASRGITAPDMNGEVSIEGDETVFDGQLEYALDVVKAEKIVLGSDCRCDVKVVGQKLPCPFVVNGCVSFQGKILLTDEKFLEIGKKGRVVFEEKVSLSGTQSLSFSGFESVAEFCSHIFFRTDFSFTQGRLYFNRQISTIFGWRGGAQAFLADVAGCIPQCVRDTFPLALNPITVVFERNVQIFARDSCMKITTINPDKLAIAGFVEIVT
ncbi:hypothetical protein HOD08_04625 [bacterium]|nr:hypothetical protein [bacterium]